MSSTVLIVIIGFLVGLVILVWLFNWLFLRGTTDRAYLRTGMGGRKVVLDGGMLVLPILHNVTSVGLGLSKAAVSVDGEAALITADRMRLDVDAEFFVRVSPTAQGVALAASSLGALANRPDDVAAFYNSEFIGALRSVAAEKSLAGVHEDRAGFVAAVSDRIAPVLARNGLELHSVAIRNLDQTPLEHFNPANRFDAEGLTELIAQVEERRQMRNAIEQRSAVAIREANLEAEKRTLALDREGQLARLQQEREIETKRAEQNAQIAREQAERTAEAETARIETAQSTNQREIAAREEVERARLASERALDESRILREQELRRLEIEREGAVELIKIDKALAVLSKSLEEAEARIQAKDVLSTAIEAEQAVSAVRVIGDAEREAAVAKVDSERDAGIEALRASIAAEAERLRNEADNLLTDDARAGRLKAQLIAKLETVIAETVKPIEKIDGIKMVHVGGGDAAGHGRTPTDEVIDSVLRYRVQAPMVDELMKEIGVDGANVSKMGDVFRPAKELQGLMKERSASSPSDDNNPSSGAKDKGDD